jgi:hypothetical protein
VSDEPVLREAEELVAAGRADWVDGSSASVPAALAAALDFASAEMLVLPLRGKVPRLPNGLTGASADLDVVAGWWRKWPAANVGVVTGAASGYVVLDVDGAAGERALAELEARHGKLETAEVATANGGRHLWFRCPVEPVRNSAGKLGDGLDVRGEGGYVVCPPSAGAHGGRYVWTRELEHAVVWPDWLTALAPTRSGPAPEVERVIPAGRRNAELASVAGTLRRRGLDAAEILGALRVVNAERCRPALDDDELERIAASVARYAPAHELGAPVHTGARLELEELVAAFRRWLHLPDAGALYVTLATVVANRLPGDPVWLLLVAPSSAGKTEILFSLAGLPEVEPAATLTEASLLSGVPRRDHTAGATGGLLRKVGEYGILTLKDFGSVLSMQRDSRAGVLAALRECYDGSWDRPVGVDGGRTLHWEGKLGLVAGVTTVVDRHHGVMDALGSRFAFYRIEVDERKAQTRRALEHVRRARGMRAELREAVARFFAGLELPADERRLAETDTERLVALADFVTQARSPVERETYSSREIELVPDAEAPARFASMLASLLEGLRIVGLEDATAWRLVAKVALDSMPAARRKVLEHLVSATSTTTKDAATVLGLPTTTARRTLEDLAAHGVVVRQSGGEGKADTWSLSPATRDDYTLGTVPEMSGSHPSYSPHTVYDDISGKVGEHP